MGLLLLDSTPGCKLDINESTLLRINFPVTEMSCQTGNLKSDS